MTKKKIVQLVFCLISFLLVAAMVVAGLIFSKDNDGEISAEEKLELVLSKTGAAMETNNKKLANSFNAAVDQKKAQAEAEDSGSQTQALTSYKNKVGAYMSDTEEELFNDCLWEINYFAGYYGFSEYFNEFLDISFLNNTYFVNQTLYDGDYYAKFVLNENSLQLLLDRKANADTNESENLDITVFFNENYNPTKMEFYSVFKNPDSETPYLYFHHATINFASSTFTYYNNSFPINTTYEQFTNFSDADLIENMRAAEYFYLNYNDVSTLDGFYIWDIEEADWGTTINSDLQANILTKCKAAGYKDFTTYSTDNFDHENALTYEKGNECINYAFNKYIIEQDSKGEYLIARQAKGIDQNVMIGIDLFAEMLLGDLEVSEQFNQLNYVVNNELTNNEDVNFKKELNSQNPIITQTITDVKNWFNNEYDSSKYYFQTITFGNYKITIENSVVNIVKLGTNSAEVLCVQSYSPNSAYVYYYNITETGTVLFSYDFAENADSWWYTYDSDAQEWIENLRKRTTYAVEYGKLDLTYSNYMANYYSKNKGLECGTDYNVLEVSNISYYYYVDANDSAKTELSYYYNGNYNEKNIHVAAHKNNNESAYNYCYEGTDVYMYFNYWAIRDALGSVGFTYNA